MPKGFYKHKLLFDENMPKRTFFPRLSYVEWKRDNQTSTKLKDSKGVIAMRVMHSQFSPLCAVHPCVLFSFDLLFPLKQPTKANKQSCHALSIYTIIYE